MEKSKNRQEIDKRYLKKIGFNINDSTENNRFVNILLAIINIIVFIINIVNVSVNSFSILSYCILFCVEFKLLLQEFTFAFRRCVKDKSIEGSKPHIIFVCIYTFISILLFLPIAINIMHNMAFHFEFPFVSQFLIITHYILGFIIDFTGLIANFYNASCMETFTIQDKQNLSEGNSI